jgi:hypothetical protein
MDDVTVTWPAEGATEDVSFNGVQPRWWRQRDATSYLIREGLVVTRDLPRHGTDRWAQWRTERDARADDGGGRDNR